MVAFETGACGDIDSSVLHPGAEIPQAVARARTICARCDVRPECLAFARRTVNRITGGLAAREGARYTVADFASVMRRR